MRLDAVKSAWLTPRPTLHLDSANPERGQLHTMISLPPLCPHTVLAIADAAAIGRRSSGCVSKWGYQN